MKNPGKALWAAEKAQQLERQALELDSQRGGDWRDRGRRRDGAARLRREAWRFRGLARNYSWEAA